MSTRKAASTLTDKPRFTAGRANKVASQRLDIRKAAQVVAVALGPARPADARHVGDRILAGQEFDGPRAALFMTP